MLEELEETVAARAERLQDPNRLLDGEGALLISSLFNAALGGNKELACSRAIELPAHLRPKAIAACDEVMRLLAPWG